MRIFTVILGALVAALGAASGCREAPISDVPSEAPQVIDTFGVPVVTGGVAGTSPAATASTPEVCIRGGTPRADVRRIMGEPDSVSYGSWLYGESEIMFGYGVVAETRNVGGNLIVC